MIGIQYTIEIQLSTSENSGITTKVYQDIVISTLVVSFATSFQCAGDAMQESTSLCVPIGPVGLTSTILEFELPRGSSCSLATS